MKNRKIYLYFITICILISALFSGFNQVNIFADEIADDSILSELYIEDSEFSKDLTNITCFDVNSSFIVYTTNSSSIEILNRRNKSEKLLKHFENIEYLKLSNKFLFIGDKKSSGSILNVYSLSNFEKINIKDETNNNFNINLFDKISIIETANDNSSQIFISTLNPTFLKYYYLITNENCIQIKSSGIITIKDINDNTSSTSPITKFSNIANSNENKIYAVAGDETNQNKLFTISVLPTIVINNPSKFYPSNASVLIVAQKNLNDYVLAISTKNVCLVKTDIPLTESIDQTNWKKGDETLEDNNGFKCGRINSPIDIKFFNGKMLVADNGTKSIQSFALNISDNGAEMIGENVLIASVCGSLGRFNKNATLSVSSNDKILVGDPLNNRIQLISNNKANVLKNTYPLSVNANHPVQFTENILFYSVKISSTTSAVIKYNLETNETLAITQYSIDSTLTSIPTILGLKKINETLIILTTKGLLTCSASSPSAVVLNFNSSLGFDENCLIDVLPNSNKIIFYSSNGLYILSEFGGLEAKTTLISNIRSLAVDEFDNIYALSDNTISKIKYLNNNFTIKSETKADFISFYDISINPTSGIIYAFDNAICAIRLYTNVDFNYIERPTSIKTANTKTYVFAKPSGLNSSNVEVLETLEIDSYKTIYSKYPISFAGNNFFIVYLENCYGYINSADVFFNEEDVVNLKESNAKINAYDKDNTVNIYRFNSIDENNIKTTLPHEYRIYVDKLDSTKTLTYITYYDENQVEQVGWVETKFIRLNGINSSQLTAIIISSIALVSGIFLLIFYIKMKNRKKA